MALFSPYLYFIFTCPCRIVFWGQHLVNVPPCCALIVCEAFLASVMTCPRCNNKPLWMFIVHMSRVICCPLWYSRVCLSRALLFWNFWAWYMMWYMHFSQFLRCSRTPLALQCLAFGSAMSALN